MLGKLFLLDKSFLHESPETFASWHYKKNITKFAAAKVVTSTIPSGLTNASKYTSISYDDHIAAAFSLDDTRFKSLLFQRETSMLQLTPTSTTIPYLPTKIYSCQNFVQCALFCALHRTFKPRRFLDSLLGLQKFAPS